MNARARLRRAALVAPAAALAIAAGCSTPAVAPLPEPLRPAAEDASQQSDADASAQAAAPGTRIEPTPGIAAQRTVAEGMADSLGADLVGDDIEATFHDVPLVSFINEVFGERLGLSFVISPALQRQADLVTLRLTEPVAPARLFATARRVLASYGIDMRDEDGVLSFFASEEAAGGEMPLIVSGRALPEVPDSHRTIFQFVPLKVTDVAAVTRWLTEVFDAQDLDVIDDPDSGSVVLKGRRAAIERALDMIELLDQPTLQGRQGIIISPVFIKAGELADTLARVLGAEGYNVTVDQPGGSIILLPLDAVDKLVAYAADAAALARVEDYARRFDGERQQSIDQALFTYEVRNTQASLLAETLNNILVGAEGRGARAADDSGADASSGGRAAAGAAAQRRRGGPLVVDRNSNLLLFRGTGREWAEIRDIVRKLDRSVPSVLIEVVIAEITLGSEYASGFEFLARGSRGGSDLIGGTLGRLGIGGKGMNLTLDRAGETRAVLNFFAENSRVEIRSSPRLLVKSGATGNIRVGNEIPTISQISERGTQVGGSTNILQEVSYRQTGISLELTPIVQANGLVDLDISQSLSEARPTAATSIAGSPTILTRDISTSLTLRDGGSLLMGGLIANSRSGGGSAVPGLADIPLLGRLFRTDSYQGDRTELIIMVIPYVVADFRAGWELTERIKDKLELHR